MLGEAAMGAKRELMQGRRRLFRRIGRRRQQRADCRC
jgi:hypothetical protein